MAMDINELNLAIDEIDKISDFTWRNSLNKRKLLELEFHDKDRDKNRSEELSKNKKEFEEFYGNKKYYNTVRRSTKYIDSWISREAKDKVFLDYACGNGDKTLFAANAGAKLSLGFDISPVSISNAKLEAKNQNVHNIRFFQADAEATGLPDNSVDTILCGGMLHHLDLSYAFPEMRRILKPGGKILAGEALNINPLIKLYRHLTPSMRTDFEKAHILSLKEIKFAKRFFDLSEIRYWHVVSYAAGKFPKLLKPLETLDNFLEKIPYVQRMAWIFTFELVKRND
jgi:ubiquinone/menaquinone biosynthesis C-methylase UbiE